MMPAKYGILSVVMCLLVACEVSQPDVQYAVTLCAPMPVARASATSFVVGGDAYVFGGRDSAGVYLNDLWRYDCEEDRWSLVGAPPLKGRVNATACVYDDVAYIGLGFCGDYSVESNYLVDWWSYDPVANQWQQLSDYPAGTTDRAISMVGDGELYVGYGFSRTYERDMYRYDIVTDTWSLIDVHLDRMPFTFPIRSFGGVGATCQGRHFAGTGFRKYSLNWWGEFLPEGSWRKCKDVPGSKRTLAACAATEDYVYVIGGMHMGGVNTTGRILADVQQYNPLMDTWLHVCDLPIEGRINHLAFGVGSRVFVGLGEDGAWQVYGDLYCIHEK